MIDGGSFASFDFPMLLFGNPADARPTVLSHLREVFEAVEVHGNISSFLSGSLLTDGFSLVDVIDASDFEIVRAVSVDAVGS